MSARSSSRWTCVALAALLLVGCAHQQYEYFEPSGDVESFGQPREWGKRALGDSELRVWSRVEDGGAIAVNLQATVPHGATLRFAGDTVRLDVDGRAEALRSRWVQGRRHDGVGAVRELPFDAPLPGRSAVGDVPDVGEQILGTYDAKFVLPERAAATTSFVLVLPAPAGGTPLRIAFARRSADYYEPVPLQ